MLKANSTVLRDSEDLLRSDAARLRTMNDQLGWVRHELLLDGETFYLQVERLSRLMNELEQMENTVVVMADVADRLAALYAQCERKLDDAGRGSLSFSYARSHPYLHVILKQEVESTQIDNAYQELISPLVSDL